MFFQAASGTNVSGFNYDGGGTISTSQAEGARTAPFATVTGISSPGAWQVINMGSDLQRQIDAGYNWAGYYFSRQQVWPNSDDPKDRLATYESGANKPYLEFQVVPEPGSLMALACGIIGLGGMFIRRKK